MPNLQQLNKKELAKIIKGFGNQGKIFQSEAQFQFELAWELQKQGWEKAILEDMTMKVVRNNKVVKKFYTDIVIEKDGYRVAIELKYKTAEYNGNGIELFDHGAVDLGRYDYLWDVHRIELFSGMSTVNDVVVPHKCNKGFAVLLTNENKYWEQNYIMCPDPPKTIDNQFRIGKGNAVLFGDTLDWEEKNGNRPKTVAGTFRDRPISLNDAYGYKWEDYRVFGGNKNNEFKFVIIEVPDNNNQQPHV